MNPSLFLLLAFGFSLTSHSAPAAYEPWLTGPCAEDARKLCADALATGSKILECMRAHESELSAGCKLKREVRRVEAAGTKGDIKKDCAADIEKFCKKPAGPKKLPEGAVVRAPRGCMPSHLAELSPGCKIHFEGAAARRPPGMSRPPKPVVAPPAPAPSSSPTPAMTSGAPTSSLELEEVDEPTLRALLEDAAKTEESSKIELDPEFGAETDNSSTEAL